MKTSSIKRGSAGAGSKRSGKGVTSVRNKWSRNGKPIGRNLKKKGAFGWDSYLEDIKGVDWVCPVDFFCHAPFANKWGKFAKVGANVEIPHPQLAGKESINCIGTIKGFAGYKALLELEKTGDAPPSYVWISYCSDVPKAIGSKTLVLPLFSSEFSQYKSDSYSWEEVSKNMLEKFYEKLPPTISETHGQAVRDELNRHQLTFKLGQIVELPDKDLPIRNRLGTIVSIIGDRVIVRYMHLKGNKHPKSMEVTASMKSDSVHPVGFSFSIGQPLKNYKTRDFSFPSQNRRDFLKYPTSVKIQSGMVFELRDPLKPCRIVAAYVYKKLRYGYFVAGIFPRVMFKDDRKFVFHITSDYILPCGFCARNNIPLHIPFGGEEMDFNWEIVSEEFIQPAALDLTDIAKKQHKFVKGCKFEASADVLQTPYFGPVTVINVAEHLLLLKFDAKTGSSVQNSTLWVSAFSPDIYPTGWAEMVGHTFHGEPSPPSLVDLYDIERACGSANNQ